MVDIKIMKTWTDYWKELWQKFPVFLTNSNNTLNPRNEVWYQNHELMMIKEKLWQKFSRFCTNTIYNFALSPGKISKVLHKHHNVALNTRNAIWPEKSWVHSFAQTSWCCTKHKKWCMTWEKVSSEKAQPAGIQVYTSQHWREAMYYWPSAYCWVSSGWNVEGVTGSAVNNGLSPALLIVWSRNCTPLHSGLSTHVSNLIKWHWNLIEIPKMRSQQNFAHATTAVLSWHVQNFVVISSLEFE